MYGTEFDHVERNSHCGYFLLLWWQKSEQNVNNVRGIRGFFEESNFVCASEFNKVPINSSKYINKTGIREL